MSKFDRYENSDSKSDSEDCESSENEEDSKFIDEMEEVETEPVTELMETPADATAGSDHHYVPDIRSPGGDRSDAENVEEVSSKCSTPVREAVDNLLRSPSPLKLFVEEEGKKLT